jgi:hypothetical protein
MRRLHDIRVTGARVTSVDLRARASPDHPGPFDSRMLASGFRSHAIDAAPTRRNPLDDFMSQRARGGGTSIAGMPRTNWEALL